MRKHLFFAVLTCFSAVASGQEVPKLKITVLSTIVADQKGVGEWGFSALVEADSSRTGLNSVYRIREVMGMTKENCLVGTVGTAFDIDQGIKTGWLK